MSFSKKYPRDKCSVLTRLSKRRAGLREAILRVEDVPMTGRQFGKKVEREVADEAHSWHALKNVAVEETIGFRVVVSPINQWIRKLGHFAGIHLPITVRLDDKIGTEIDRFLEASSRGGTDAKVRRVLNHLEASAGHAPEDWQGGVSAPVVDRDDPICKWRNGAQDAQDVILDVKARNYNADSLSFVHGSLGANARNDIDRT